MTVKSWAARLAWLKADAEADAAEAELTDEWKQFEAGAIATAPSKDLPKEISRLRAQADEKLTVAIALLSRGALNL
jgi:hypothetical protein